MKIKYIRYCRKSSEQAERQALSIDSQKRELNRKFSNLNVIRDIEESKSSFHPHIRPKFTEMIQLIQSGEANGIIAWHPDRLSRNEIDAATITYLIRTGFIKDIKFGSYSFDNSPEGIMMLQMALSQSQYFSSKLSKDVKRGLKEKAEIGWYPTHAPVGYQNTPEKAKGYKTVELDPIRHRLVTKVFEEIIKGKQAIQVWRIARNEWKLTAVNNKPISRSTFYKMLTNPFYCGIFEWPNNSGNWYDGKHKPLITKEQFDVVQQSLGQKGKPRPQKHKFTYTGLFKCAECGCYYTATKKVKHYKTTGNTRVYKYYHCTKKNPDHKCQQKPLTKEEVEKQIASLVSKFDISEEFVAWARKWLKKLHSIEIQDRTEIYQSQQRAYNASQKRLDRLLDAHIDGMVTATIYKSKKHQIEQEIETLKEKLEDTEHRAKSWHKTAEDAVDFAYTVREKFKKAKPEEKKLLLKQLGSNFLINDKKVLITLEKTYKTLSESEKWEEKYSDSLEPVKYADILAKSPDLRPANPVWLPG